ncbi:hypothetical protein MUY14_17780 [Amycolatopsis sp. FBCC-B4732]|uniref:hypothetical protein n=1 Tax=Amycolatopsis sp. FBCC-B4732 TaxID=3079339 RepID=UPI001FF6C718|nr:hypothetical protein [Amycolatopsis sp. FBCC-B4732]UOX92375.1 hypothetical protein MUY14_17780 [Amycolatopsis sp. FBCC-B4732]
MSPVEIACDESGSEGENLLGGETDVFAHAGVRLSPEAAAACVREIRARIGSPAEEYKASCCAASTARCSSGCSTPPVRSRAAATCT